MHLLLLPHTTMASILIALLNAESILSATPINMKLISIDINSFISPPIISYFFLNFIPYFHISIVLSFLNKLMQLSRKTLILKLLLLVYLHCKNNYTKHTLDYSL